MIRPIEGEDPQYLQNPSEVHAQATQLVAKNPSSASEDHPSVLLDVLAAPFRGVESAVRNTYGVLDFITADALPDYDQNFLGSSKTTAGSVVENVSQFLTGFIPVAGWIGRAGSIAGKIGRAASAGAAIDFTLFDAHEERLSNFLRDNVGLRDPITEYLAADADDSEIEGRFKNALEGLGVGLVADGLTGVLKNLKAVRAIRSGTELEQAKKAARLAEAEEGITASVNSALDSVKTQKIDKSLLPDADPKPSKSLEVAEEEAKQYAEWKKILSKDTSALEKGGYFQSPNKPLSRVLDSKSDFFTFYDELVKEQTEKLGKSPSESFEELGRQSAARLADLHGVPADAVERSLRQGLAMGVEAQVRADVAVKMTVALAQEVNQFAKYVTQGIAAPGDQSVAQTALRAVKAQQFLSNLTAISKGYGTVAGRMLRQRNQIHNVTIESLDVAKSMLDGLGGEEMAKAELAKVVEAFKQHSDPFAAAGAVTKLSSGKGDKLLRAHNEFWMNAILSGTKTSLVNVIGNSMTTAFAPLEQALGSLVSGNLKGVRAGLKNYAYLATSVREAGQFFLRSLKDNDSFLLDNAKSVVEDRRGPFINAGKFGGPETTGLVGEASALAKREGNMLSHAVNFFGETVRLPQRFLTATDEFFQQLNYRSAAKTELYYQGLDRGLSGEQLSGYIAEHFDKTITEGGRRYSEAAIYRDAISKADAQGLQGRARNDFVSDYVRDNWDPKASALSEVFDAQSYANNVAEEATFTAPLGKLGRGVQQFAQSHPLFQLVLPFVRTPTNIVKYFGQRGLSTATFLPVVDNLQARNLAELGSADALVRSKAVGRIAAGHMMVTMAAFAALEGKITGKGPRDEAEARLWKETGAQPYSIVFDTAEGKHYVSFQRLDPFATFLGLVADWADTARRQDALHGDVLENTVTALGTAVSNNITNKTYLASLAQLIDAINQPERRFATWTRSRVASYVPSFISQFTTVTDDGQTMKEIRGYWDAMANRVPGLQGSLEPKRNILGEPVEGALAQTPAAWVNPVVVSKDRNDALFTELSKLGHGIQSPSPRVYGVIDLLGEQFKTSEGRTAYDRWQELIGSTSVGGKSLRDRLTKLVKSTAYQKLPDGDESGGFTSPRVSEINRVLGVYRDAAFRELQREVPQLRQAIRTYQTEKAGLRRGKRAEQLAALLQ